MTWNFEHKMEATDKLKVGVADDCPDCLDKEQLARGAKMESDAKKELTKAADYGTHISEGGDDALYKDPGQTDLNSTKNLATFDDYDLHGGSAGKKKPGDSTTLTTDQVMNREDMPKVDFRDPKKVSENPDGGFYDASNSPSTPKEGEVLGLQPSYTAADVYLALSGPQVDWGFGRESLFDRFIGNVGEILAACRQAGASRAAAREAVIQVHSTLFAKHEWMSPILDRFLDRTYGTTAKPKSALSTLEGCISDYVVTARKNGWPKSKTIESSINEFYSWIENYPDTQRMIEDKVDAAYGVNPGVLKPFLGANVANEYATQLFEDFDKFPLPYAEFRRWCAAKQVPIPTLYALERVALELKYVTMPEARLIFADEQELYVSEDKTKTQTLPKNPDTTKTPEEISLSDGTKLKRMKE